MLKDPKKILKSLPNKPGVYQMLDIDGQVLYVGKAKNLKKRVQSYFRSTGDLKTKAFMSQVNDIEIVVAPSENDAWLLESNLIKLKKPRYNILFKDDKSFPYLLLSKHEFPRLSIYRGPVKKSLGKFFGPFPDASAVNFIFNLAQKIFQLRVCKDGFMKNRSRPCMLHQIKLCSAPCKNYIDKKSYLLQVELLEKFLQNKNDQLVLELTKLMDGSSQKLDYENAAKYRNQIASVRKVQTQQSIVKVGGNSDVIAVLVKDGALCINLLFVRNGLVIGGRNYFPEIYDFTESHQDVFLAFIRHYYLQMEDDIGVPGKIFFNVKLDSGLKLSETFSNKFGRKITVSNFVRGSQKQLMDMAEENAANALRVRVVNAMNINECLIDFKNIFSLSDVPRHIECFDVSHTMGEALVASCVVFKEDNFSKKDYRRFNIKTTLKGDDYQALYEAMFRHFSSLDSLPDVIMVDGGRGQLNVASKVLKDLNIIKGPVLISIAKGKERKPGLEEIYLEGIKEPVVISPDSSVFHLIQRIRDEAHRFAIEGHRRKMRGRRLQSELENIPGVGKLKRSLLLKHFGGLSQIRGAGVNDLAKVGGIGRELAKRIYDYLHA